MYPFRCANILLAHNLPRRNYPFHRLPGSTNRSLALCSVLSHILLLLYEDSPYHVQHPQCSNIAQADISILFNLSWYTEGSLIIMMQRFSLYLSRARPNHPSFLLIYSVGPIILITSLKKQQESNKVLRDAHHNTAAHFPIIRRLSVLQRVSNLLPPPT